MMRYLYLIPFALISGCSFVRPMVCTAPPSYLMEPLPDLVPVEPDRADGSLSMPGAYRAWGEDVISLKACRARVRQFQEWHD